MTKTKYLQFSVDESGVIDTQLLDELGFAPLQESPFENTALRYRVKNAICLFTNEQEYNDSWLIGHASMHSGKYYLSTFRWIDKFKELKNIYESIINKQIDIPND